MSLMLMCGGEKISKAELANIAVPEDTDTYRPIPFINIVDLIERRVKREFVRDDYDLAFGVNKERTRLFGVLALKDGGSARTPTIGFRSSLDKSLRPAVCGGGRVTVCDNLMFSGDFFNVQRTQTGRAWEDFEMLIMGGVAKLEDQFGSLENECQHLEEIELSQLNGWRELGVIHGQQLLTNTQVGAAYRGWNDRWKGAMYNHTETAWTFYNTLTRAMKKGNPGNLMNQYIGVHAEMQDRFLQEEAAEVPTAH